MKTKLKKRGEKMNKMEEEFKKKVEEQNKKIAHIIWIVFISMVTSIITVFVSTGLTGL